ncbi:MAG: GNAT family N-acetyltransferase [Acidimicrobiales bacterium]
MPADEENLAHLAAFVRSTAAAGRTLERVGPFLATFTEGDANPYLNYAIPDDGAAPSPDEVAALVEAFRRRNRVSRAEYFPALCPSLEAVLAPAGFVIEAVLALMGAGARDLREIATRSEFTVRPPATPDELAAAARVQNAAFGQAEPAGADLTSPLDRVLRNGGFVATACEPAAGRVVGAGNCSAVRDGFAEITGIAVAEAWRGRGLASSLTWSLATMAFSAGAELVFLTPGSSAALRSYARVGFRRIGDQVHTSLRRAPGGASRDTGGASAPPGRASPPRGREPPAP